MIEAGQHEAVEKQMSNAFGANGRTWGREDVLGNARSVEGLRAEAVVAEQGGEEASSDQQVHADHCLEQEVEGKNRKARGHE